MQPTITLLTPADKGFVGGGGAVIPSIRATRNSGPGFVLEH